MAALSALICSPSLEAASRVPQRGFGRLCTGGIDQDGNASRLRAPTHAGAPAASYGFVDEEIDAGDVAAWTGEAGDEAELHRVVADTEDDGMVEVAALAASAAGGKPGVTMTATRRRTKSATSAGTRWYWPSSQ